ncbi:nephrocystin-1 isoform X2 [Hydra vulgaris]|uniref:nephrocystin-1 isoform X2 n=1 Tax=Hydra vulgaris TaxID=6087 RepID=UPI001F5EFFF5|nr:nephrocystin-1 isoform X2 [Hydra vulgaris]
MSNKKPPSGTSSQLIKLTREIDRIKFKVDDICSNELPNIGVASSDRLAVLNVVKELQNDVGLIIRKLKTLTATDERMVTSIFEKQKSQESQRILNLQSKLNSIIDQLEPDKVEEDYFRSLSPQQKIKGNRKMKQEILTEDEDGSDLSESISKGDKHTSLSEGDQDEEENNGENDDDEQEKNGEDYDDNDDDDDDDNDDDDDDDDEEEEEDSEVKKKNIRNKDNYIYCVEALSDFKAEQEGDLTFLKGEIIYITKANEDGWWDGVNKKGDNGLVPSTLVKVVEDNTKRKLNELSSSTKKKSGKELWDSTLRKSSPPAKIGVTDVLKAMKAVPSGFRNSTLGKLYKLEVNRASSWVHPKASSSNVQFDYLFWDNINEQLRCQSVSICRIISLISARSIPIPGVGISILSRHIYITLWDNSKILSNIHVVRAVPTNIEENWAFTPKVTKMIPSLYDGEVIVRANIQNKDVCVLFELNYTYVRLSTGEVSDICCGWASLPLFDEVGAPVENKSFELTLKGGTPFEKGVVLDMTLSLNSNQSFLQNLIHFNRQPRIIVKTTNCSKLDKETFDLLPDTLVTCQKYSRFIGLYRHHAALLCCKEETISSEPICDPILSHFPRALDFADMMDALNMTWNEKSRISLKRAQRRDVNYLHSLFEQCFYESIYGLFQVSNLPSMEWANENVERARYGFIMDFLQRKNALGNLLSSDIAFKPLNVNKLKFDVVSKHTAKRPPILSSDITSL